MLILCLLIKSCRVGFINPIEQMWNLIHGPDLCPGSWGSQLIFLLCPWVSLCRVTVGGHPGGDPAGQEPSPYCVTLGVTLAFLGLFSYLRWHG